ncbi:Aminopeptidase N [Ooceraea biroi]|uniref:Aminopeptidase N n=1 Tax=Ooceraea biroi TaxID=2015173 RepID=A0A026W563_OOCBI|nr:Aminopeptidase N [Ooceraea biroi]
MKFLKQLLHVSVIFTIVVAICADENSENNSSETVIYRLSDDIIPVHYNIKLIPYMEEGNFTFDGESNISIKVRNTTQSISLHSVELKVNETATTLINVNGVIYKPVRHSYHNKTAILVLHFNDELSSGSYSLNIKFVGILHHDVKGFFKLSYKNEEGSTEWLIATQLESTHARQVFPCWDEPALKATFNISVKHHQKYKALSNMPIRKKLMAEHSMVWSHFNTTPVMSTYIIAIVIFDFTHIHNVNKTINVWFRPPLISQVTFANDVANRAVQYLVQYTNISEIVPKTDHIAIPHFSVEGMENWGLIIYNEARIIYDENIHFVIHKQDAAILIAHELAHQWFGNLVTPSWWSDLWLSEGFATYFQSYILDKMFKDWRMTDLMVVKQLHKFLRYDIGDILYPITFDVNHYFELDDIRSAVVYDKACVILRMLQHLLTEKVFQKGIIMYLNKHNIYSRYFLKFVSIDLCVTNTQFSTVTANDLWTAMQIALNESDILHKDYKIKEVMDTWIKQNDYPTVLVTRNYKTNETRVSQEHFRLHALNDEDDNNGDNNNGDDNNGDDKKWWIPVTFTTQTNLDFSNTVPKYWLTPVHENVDLIINSNDWIIVNLQQTGYYRVNYDPTNWLKITSYLKSEEYTKIHVLNRAQLIDDAYHFLMTKQLSLSIFMNLMSYLSRETDYVAWFPVFQIVSRMQKFFLLPLQEIATFKVYNNKISQYILNIK